MLIDSFGRKIDYLRISLTQQCNFRCVYCMPDTPEDFFDPKALELSKLLEFVKIALDNGIKKIRLTGGEPLLRPDIAEFIAGIYAHNKNTEIALTSNAFLLEKFAKKLKDAGLKRINISLDSLKNERIRVISKKDALPQILRGIESAQKAGLKVKLNMVALRYTQDEILDMLEFAKSRGIMLRYIEFMENIHAKNDVSSLECGEILSIISTRYALKPLQKENFGPAKIWEIDEPDKSKSDGCKPYAFGIIAPHEDDFCESCNRIRLTSEGVLCPCLFYQDSVDVSEAIINGDKARMEELLKLAVINKPEKNQWSAESGAQISSRAFYHTGG
ncbi:GTP 3',8-cyclase MoaA [Helicobacter himalayensis]|uniref:GTP 3',8-cyclase MoaA n=1 Tax=Helicobacter himalayensis TaxID=1591088 RepID=UPI00082CE66D|nr:GTP 3',8-cyclase MoaA [Helicobacter himalayensis]